METGDSARKADLEKSRAELLEKLDRRERDLQWKLASVARTGETGPVANAQDDMGTKEGEWAFRTLRQIAGLRRLVASWGMETGVFSGKAGLGVVTGKLVEKSGAWLSNLWNFEIYAVEDTVSLNGQRVAVTYGITLGKVVVLVLMLLAGWIVLRWMARRFEKALLAKPGMDPSKALLLRRWLFLAGMIVLTLTILHFARIPLTTFAFLGGALAIGVGFGTQTILKNFISGIILLVERPFRVNDILHIGEVKGRLTQIGLRACVIEQWDGIETLIPNSALLEGNVTNWTYSTHRIRGEVKVGVAYGSDLRLVKKALLDAAADHGEVLKEPPPAVLVEDFADNAILMNLQFWLEVPRSGLAGVSSDLRFMIDKVFRERGIGIPFPQLDVHWPPQPGGDPGRAGP
jgi:small-conductance mechanosensitive channel